MTATPVSLLERLRQPEREDAWRRFVDLYTPLLFHWGRRAGLQEPDAADLVQDVLLVLIQKLPEFSYDRHRSFRAWLRTVLLNRWRNNYRRRVAAPREVREALDSLAGPDDGAAFEEAEYRQHLIGRMMELLRTDFDPATWQAFWECVACDRPATEVAAELGLKPGAVRAAKFRVLCRLRQDLNGLLD